MTEKQNEVQQQDAPMTEDDVVEAVRAKKRSRPRAPRLKIDFDEDERVASIEFDHEDQTIASTLAMYDVGTADVYFFHGILKQVAALGASGHSMSEDATNFALSVIRSVDPQNEVEAMLAAQMAATHLATMTFARRLNHVETIPQQDSAERALNKLARTFTRQMEALKKYRAKADQTVRVERVYVNAGGQAIVGNVQAEKRIDR